MPGVPNISHVMSIINHTSYFLYLKVFGILFLHLTIYRRLRSRFDLRKIKCVLKFPINKVRANLFV